VGQVVLLFTDQRIVHSELSAEHYVYYKVTAEVLDEEDVKCHFHFGTSSSWKETMNALDPKVDIAPLIDQACQLLLDHQLYLCFVFSCFGWPDLTDAGPFRSVC